mmetsp:Transcript_39497/g.58027  ORF Transcript_39497/g.58027 Transcript_39497/m.58027 type:complete len:248 (-) Transcript_39497:283-1026(-)
MDIETAANVAEPVANSLSCCGTLHDSINQKSCKIKVVNRFFLVVDLVNVVLDYNFTKQLSDMGENGLSALSGVMTTLGFLVLLIYKRALDDARDNIMYKILASELLIWMIEDLTTLYIFTIATGAYDPSVPSSVVNLWITIISGIFTFATMWAYLFFHSCCHCEVLLVWGTYLIIATFALCYFTIFAFMYLIPAKTIADIEESEIKTIFTMREAEDELSLPTSVYIFTQSVSWMNVLCILCSICQPP